MAKCFVTLHLIVVLSFFIAPTYADAADVAAPTWRGDDNSIHARWDTFAFDEFDVAHSPLYESNPTDPNYAPTYPDDNYFHPYLWDWNGTASVISGGDTVRFYDDASLEFNMGRGDDQSDWMAGNTMDARLQITCATGFNDMSPPFPIAPFQIGAGNGTSGDYIDAVFFEDIGTFPGPDIVTAIFDISVANDSNLLIFLQNLGPEMYYEIYDINLDIRTYDAATVPIPSAIWLLGSGLIGLVGFHRKLRN